MTELIKDKTSSFTMLPPSPDVCQECAVKHKPEEPHDATSFYLLYKILFLTGDIKCL